MHSALRRFQYNYGDIATKGSRDYPQARSQDFCVGGRFEQKVDLFVLFFLSVKGGGGMRGHAHATLF